jgi:chemotaxis protein methyltransferase CheR
VSERHASDTLAARPPSIAAPPLAGTPELGDGEFRAISALTKRVAGIHLQPGKDGLVRARLAKRIRALGLAGFPAYLRHVEQDESRAELKALIDALTTNKTSFFREPQHFDYLRDVVLPSLAGQGRAPRLWSAGCSSGEEAYTLGMVLRDGLPEPLARDARILATDISARVLECAERAVYAPELLADLRRDLVRRHFVQLPTGEWRVAEPVRRLVRVARLNLMGAWPMRGPFDAIFCRNVMIYFDKPTQGALVERFWEQLAPGGHLFVGHSESLTGVSHRFRFVRPAVYVR